MTKRRYVLTISLILLPLVLFHFQNCAPAGPVSVGSASGDTGGGQVGIADGLGKSQIQFVTESAQVQDDATSVDLSGLCARAHDGASLKWTVWDENNSQQQLAVGTSACNKGQFAVTLQQLDQFVCGVPHMLVVEGDWGSSTYSYFTRRCQPTISVEQPAPSDMPYGTSCTLEYSPATVAENPCARVCYRASQVVLTQPLDVSACSALASSLAGQ